MFAFWCKSHSVLERVLFSHWWDVEYSYAKDSCRKLCLVMGCQGSASLEMSCPFIVTYQAWKSYEIWKNYRKHRKVMKFRTDFIFIVHVTISNTLLSLTIIIHVYQQFCQKLVMWRLWSIPWKNPEIFIFLEGQGPWVSIEYQWQETNVQSLSFYCDYINT